MQRVGDRTDRRCIDEDTIVAALQLLDHREELGVVDDLRRILAAQADREYVQPGLDIPNNRLVEGHLGVKPFAEAAVSREAKGRADVRQT